jgi:hypothetical protein
MLPLYTQQTIDGDGDDDGEVDEDGDVVNLAVCVYESCEFLVTVMDGGKKAQAVLKSLQEPMALLAIGYMQMTTDDLAAWEEDPGEFCAFEDDFLQSLSVRVAAHKLMLRMLDVYVLLTPASHNTLTASHNIPPVGTRVRWVRSSAPPLSASASRSSSGLRDRSRGGSFARSLSPTLSLSLSPTLSLSLSLSLSHSPIIRIVTPSDRLRPPLLFCSPATAHFACLTESNVGAD